MSRLDRLDPVRSRRRRAGRHPARLDALSLAATIAVAAALGCCAVAAHANAPFVTITPISDGNPATDEQGRANTPINAVAFKRQSLTSVGGYQFTSYYHSDGQLMLGRRKQIAGGGWTDWTIRKTAFTSFNINDSHNTSTIGIDGDGILHVAWGLHNNVMQYTRSNGSVLNDNAFTLTGDTTGNNTTTGVLAQEIPLYNQSITYPEFYNVPGSGDLLLGYRTGGSGNGDAHLVRWNNTSNAWQGVRVGTSQDSANPFIDNIAPVGGLPNASPYLHSLAFDSQGKLHVSFTYRYGSDSPSQNPHFSDYQTNHDFFYAVSNPADAAGGGYATWRKQDGTLYRRNGLHDIDENNAQRIASIPEGSSLINQADMTIDRNDRPIIASWWAPGAAQGNHLRQYMIAWYDGAQWKTSQVSNRNAENNNARVAESQLGTYNMARPIVMVDESNRVFVVFSDHQRGNVVSVAYTDSPNRDQWTILDLTTENLSGWEPSFDRNRWANDGILSLYYQPINGQVGSTVSILEWNARAFFATDTSIHWDVDADGQWTTAANWSTDVVPDGTGVAVRFGGAGTPMTGPHTIDLDAGTRTVGSLTLNGTANTGFTLVNGTLALANGASPATLTVNGGGQAINANLTLNAAGAAVNVGGGATTLFTIRGDVSGPGTLTKAGTGTLVLTGNASHAATAVTGGTLQVGDGSTTGSLGSGPVTVSAGGTLAFNRADGVSIANLIGGADGSVRQAGTGVLTLTGANTFGTGTGSVGATAGTLRRGSTQAFASGVNLFTSGAGRIDLNGMNLTAGTINGTGGTITDDGVAVGTTSLVVGAGGTSDYAGSIDDGATRTLALTKTGAGTLRLRGASGYSGGTTISRGFVEAFGDDAFGTGAITMNPLANTNAADATRITLAAGVRIDNPITMVTANSGVQTGALQSTGAATFAGGIAIQGNAVTGGHFAGPASGELNITGAVNATAAVDTLIVRLGRVRFSGGGSYNGMDIRAGTTSLGADNGLSILAVVDIGGNAATGTPAVFDLNGFDQTLRGIRNAITPTNAALITNSGVGQPSMLTLNMGDGATQSFGGSITGNLGVRVISGTQVLTRSGTTSQNGNYFYGGPTIVDGPTAVLRLTPAAWGPTLSGAGGADVRDGRLIFSYAGASTPRDTVLPLLANGRAANFASGQIRSTSAAAGWGLAWIDDAAASTFTLTPARYGDTDVNGIVDFDDLLTLAQNYGATSGASWATGDSTYDRRVDFDDLLALAQNYGRSGLTSGETAALGVDLAADFALAQSLVPEPTSLVTLGLCAVSLRRRRRLTKAAGVAENGR